MRGEGVTPVPARVRWQLAEFAALSGRDLYELLALRARVFVVEQDCVFLDPDGRDPEAMHLLGWAESPERAELIAYARIFAPGVRYDEMSIGRIVTAPEVRGTGVGRAALHEALRHCAEKWPGRPIRIAAQERLEEFYSEFGFVRDGEPYLHDGIDHLDMILAAT